MVTQILSENLGYLVGIIVQVTHHEVILLRDDVPGHQDVGGQALGADVLQQDRGLTCVIVRSNVQLVIRIIVAFVHLIRFILILNL